MTERRFARMDLVGRNRVAPSYGDCTAGTDGWSGVSARRAERGDSAAPVGPSGGERVSGGRTKPDSAVKRDAYPGVGYESRASIGRWLDRDRQATVS